MMTIAIRGATTITKNEKNSILEATKELLVSILEENKIEIEEISSIIFTATKDITKAYPAVAAREIGITDAALMCVQEMHVEGSLAMCIRVMVQIQRKDLGQPVRHVYLHNARRLRPDLAKPVAIAIDGPAGAGKSTIAKRLSHQLGYIYIDTGAMYRAVAYYCKQNKIDVYNEKDVISQLDHIDIKIRMENGTQCIYLNGENVSELIRSQAIAKSASIVASYQGVRKQLVKLQRQIAQETSLVMDGRDIGSHVLPNAKLKIFLTASVIERATRRFKELQQNGYSVDLEEIKKEIIDRDHKDSSREFSPLCKAPDATEIDTTGKSIEQVTAEILEQIKDLS